MKKATQLISVLLSVIIIMTQSSFAVFASTTSKSKYTGSTYTHQSRFDGYDIINGIDISQHNGSINFNKVKADGIDYVFIRVGYTGYTKSSFSLNYDTNYKTYIKNAIAAGLKVGVYWYSQALNTNEAVQEASKLLKAIENYNITMPVVFDYEFADTSSGRLDSAKLSKAKMTENALAFLDTVSSAGYDACLYANQNFLTEKVDSSKISSVYKIWLANYTTNATFKGNFDFWQYTSKGKISGISGNVDVNFWYSNPEDAEELDAQYYTGYPITLEPAVFDDGVLLTNNVDYTLSYSNNTNVGTAVITATGINEHEGFFAQYKFKILPQKVTGVTITSTKETSVSYTWNKVAGANSYRIYVVNNTYGTAFSKTVTTNSCTINNLTAGNNYSVKICAGINTSNSSTIWGEYSDVNDVVTLGTEVTGLKVKSRSTTAIRLTWNKVKDCDGYVVYMYSDLAEQYIKLEQIDNVNNYKIDDLEAGETYKFKVSAIKNGIEGKPSKYLKAVTKPNKAKVSSAKSSAKKKITIKYNVANCDGYQIQWSTNKNFSSNSKTVTVSSSTKSKTIKTAQSKKKYYVRVRAFSKANGVKVYGAWSATKTVTVK